MLFFLCVYAAVFWFVRRHARKVDRDPEQSLVAAEDRRLRAGLGTDSLPPEDAMTTGMRRAVICFAAAMAAAFIFVFATSRDPMLSDLALPLMALSVRHIVDSGGITDTILHAAANGIEGRSPLVAALLIYAVTLAMNFFIGSASALP